jgi:adenosylmethionine-8-amino-7-oxononanoate aminotransferase
VVVSQSHIAAGSTQLIRPALAFPSPTFVAGEGIELVTASGNRVLDAISGVGVTCLGYTAPAVVQRMAEQAARLPYAHAMRFDTPVLQELAERVAALTPGSLNRCFFVSGGSEAVESAIKFARQYWLEAGDAGKWRVVGRWPSFHGNTIAALSAGWHASRRARHQPLLLDFPHIEAPDTYRGCGHCRGQDGCTLACADELERVVVREGPDTIAAFIAEPLVGAAGGAIVPHDDYFPRIREICDQYGLLLVADEVITGFGRTGRWFGIEHWDVEPDLIVFAKGISGGFVPLGGFAARDELVETFVGGSGRFEHNFTMAGHAVAAAAGCAVLEELVRRDAAASVRANERAFFDSLESLRGSSLVGDIRGKGYLAGVELVLDRASRTAFPVEAHAAERVAAHALEEGLLVYPCSGGFDGKGDHLLLMPALVTPPDVFTEISTRLRRALDRAEADLR